MKKIGISVLLFFALPNAAFAGISPEQVLSDAAHYTVKIDVLSRIGLNQDAGGSGSGTGFLIDKKRGWILTNAHVSTRSPGSIKVSFKDHGKIVAKRIHVDPLTLRSFRSNPLRYQLRLKKLRWAVMKVLSPAAQFSHMAIHGVSPLRLREGLSLACLGSIRRISFKQTQRSIAATRAARSSTYRRVRF